MGGIPATVASIEYDPNRTSFIALLNYQDGEKRYIIAQNGLQVGQNEVSANEGASPQLLAREGKYATIKLPSGEIRRVLSLCIATIGAVSNSDHQLMVGGKAGRSRWLGIRPRTRPVAMNPVDHPMGG